MYFQTFLTSFVIIWMGSVEARPRRDCPSICPTIYSPVCGSDGKTYSNKCAIGVRACVTGDKELKVKGEGPCVKNKCRRGCPFLYRPVCASNGQIFTNYCLMEIEACKLGIKLRIVNDINCDYYSQKFYDDDEDENTDYEDENEDQKKEVQETQVPDNEDPENEGPEIEVVTDDVDEKPTGVEGKNNDADDDVTDAQDENEDQVDPEDQDPET